MSDPGRMASSKSRLINLPTAYCKPHHDESHSWYMWWQMYTENNLAHIDEEYRAKSSCSSPLRPGCVCMYRPCVMMWVAEELLVCIRKRSVLINSSEFHPSSPLYGTSRLSRTVPPRVAIIPNRMKLFKAVRSSLAHYWSIAQASHQKIFKLHRMMG